MRVGVDARLNAYRQGGIAHYTAQLLAAMAARPDAPELLALQHVRQREPLLPGARLRRATLYTPPHHRLEQWALPLELLPRRLSLLHSPDVIPPLRRPCPAVITIHDLAFLHFPEILDTGARRYYGQIHAAARSAEAIIAVSQATRADIVGLLGLPPERVDVIYEAAATTFRPLGVPAGARRRVNGHDLAAGTFALFLSTIEPRKNIETLLRALRLCRERRPQAGYRLVLAGAAGWLCAPIYALTAELGLGDAALFLGGVSPDDLLWLYNACRLYVNPSIYEGFGLPALEALACGAAVAVADTSSLPEICGDAARLVPPRDVAAWAETIADLWDDEAARRELGRRGVQRAATFSWERAAAETLAVYRRVIG